MNIKIINPSLSRFWLEKTVSGSLYFRENYNGFFSEKRVSTRSKYGQLSAIDHVSAGRSVCWVSPIFSWFLRNMSWGKKLSIPSLHAMIVFCPFSSLKKISGTWVMQRFHKLLRVVPYPEQKAKEIGLENIWGRAVVVWYQRVLETIFEWETENGYL